MTRFGVSLRPQSRTRIDRPHHAAVWYAWRGKLVGVEAVVIAKVVTYHLLCWKRGTWLGEREKWN